MSVRFGQLGEQEESIREQRSELFGVYVPGYGSEQFTVNEVSEMFDAFGWKQGWRSPDTDDLTIDRAMGDEGYLTPWSPFVFILDTRTMTIVESEHDGVLLDVPEVVTALNEGW